MKVIKTRTGAYHTDPDCKGLEKVTRSTADLPLDMAIAWDLRLCGECRETHVKPSLPADWAQKIEADGY